MFSHQALPGTRESGMPTPVRSPLTAVPSECEFSLKWFGFDKVPEEEQVNWLKARFFRPSGWAEAESFAAVKSVRRIRKYCWRAIAPLVAEKARDTNSPVRGRPVLRREKAFALQLVVHEPDSAIPEAWQWPLVEVAITSNLPPEESLWVLTRGSVLPGKVARLCALEVARAGAELVDYNTARAFTYYSDLIHSGALTASYRGGVRALLQSSAGNRYIDEHVLNAFEAVASREPHFALRRAIAHAGAACCAYDIAVSQILTSFLDAVRRTVLREMV